MPDLRKVIGATIVLASLGGCSFPGGSRPQPEEQVDAISAAEARQVVGLLTLLESFADATPARQAEIEAEARRAAELEPSPYNRLRHGLIVGLPGHDASDLSAAHSDLREMIATPHGLSPAEVSLLAVISRHLEARIATENESRNRSHLAGLDSQNRVQGLNRRLTSLAEENALLRAKLEEAQDKLKAVAALERKLTERESGTRRPPP